MFPPSIKGLLYYFLLVKSISTCKIEYAGDTTFGSFEKSSFLSYFFQNMLHKPLISENFGTTNKKCGIILDQAWCTEPRKEH